MVKNVITRRMYPAIFLCVFLTLSFSIMPKSFGEFAKQSPVYERPLNATFEFGGPMGERIDANLESWLLSAPDANPGMLEMFRVRDRKPIPRLVPWAGEFVGKYLISAIQARRMTGDARLDQKIRWVISELINSQADDGYLGPFPKEDRLLKNWDLWGHYHVMLALMMWSEDTGDEAAKSCAIRAADLICNTYLDTGRHVFDAGSFEMNMAVIHVLGRVYRETGNERYLRMMREIEKDFERAGDYFRQGLAGVDFYKQPLPRWESLHDIQGLVELYRITGNEDYKTAYENIWRSIARYDRHNTGGFSSGEQAIGDPYEPGAIETCCTTAWSALTVDMLYLTADSQVADELELSLWNSILGSQHPTGRWWTYNTPMDGCREASAHTIVFQSRAGTPELNCCSVNAPRGIGMISEWGVLVNDNSVAVNYYGPMRASIPVASGAVLEVNQETDYPAGGHIKLTFSPGSLGDRELLLRIPAWSSKTRVTVDGKVQDAPEPGRYFKIKPDWSRGVVVELELDMSIHTWIGDGATADNVSLYYGPLLLAFDSHFNEYDVDDVPAISLNHLAFEKPAAPGRFRPLVFFAFQGVDGQKINLCDFATAGAYGTHYRSWLPVADAPPPKFWLRSPEDGVHLSKGPNVFEWTGTELADGRKYRLAVATDRSMQKPIATREFVRKRVLLKDKFDAGKTYYWQVTAFNEFGEQSAELGPRSFVVDAALPNPYIENPALVEFREDGLVAASPLDGNGQPVYGALRDEKGIQAAPDRNGNADGAVKFEGQGMIRYQVPYFPSDDYTFMAWVKADEKQKHGLAQIFSGWAKGGDDPLRVVIDGAKLYARVEGQGNWSTRGYALKSGEWTHIAAVKDGSRLRLFVNGDSVGETHVPFRLRTVSIQFALGGNPLHSGPEFFCGCIDDFSLYAKALTTDEIRESMKK